MTDRRRASIVLALAAVAVAAPAIFLTMGRADSPEPSKALPEAVLKTVPNEVFEDYGVGILPATAAERASRSAPTTAQVTESIAALSSQAALKEAPTLVRFRTQVPGVPETAGLLWALVLEETPHFSGSGAGGRGHTPSAEVVGTYSFVFLNADTMAPVYAIQGEIASQHQKPGAPKATPAGP